MSEARYTRPRHRLVATALAALNAGFLRDARCYFGGGTRIVLELDEYRESADLDFLCASREGYRMLRGAVSDRSLGAILARPLALAREVRADRYGIRTFLHVGEAPLKLELIQEARIDLTGAPVAGIGVACLDRRACFAEKFLANADRWGDESVASRDLIDLAFMMARWRASDARAGLEIAAAPYGAVVIESLDRALDKLRRSAVYVRQCVRTLSVNDEPTLKAGLARLRSKRWR